jgi:tetratricopeptide (TPR) repeat protein
MREATTDDIQRILNRTAANLRADELPVEALSLLHAFGQENWNHHMYPTACRSLIDQGLFEAALKIVEVYRTKYGDEAYRTNNPLRSCAAKIYHSTGRYEDAERELAAVLQQKPEDIRARKNYAEFLLEQGARQAFDIIRPYFVSMMAGKPEARIATHAEQMLHTLAVCAHSSKDAAQFLTEVLQYCLNKRFITMEFAAKIARHGHIGSVWSR